MRHFVVSADGHRSEITDLLEVRNNAGDALVEFLETMEADYELTEEIKQELEENDVGNLKRIFGYEAPFVLKEDDEDGY